MKIMILPMSYKNRTPNGILSYSCPSLFIGIPFKIEDVSANKLFFVTYRDATNDYELDNLFYYPPNSNKKNLRTHGLADDITPIFLPRHSLLFGGLPEPVLYVESNDAATIANIKNEWNRNMCLTLCDDMEYFDDSIDADAEFIDAYIDIFEAVNKSKSYSTKTLSYLYCSECYLNSYSRYYSEKRTFKQSFLDYCREKINLQYEELTVENYTKFLDKMKEYYTGTRKTYHSFLSTIREYYQNLLWKENYRSYLDSVVGKSIHWEKISKGKYMLKRSDLK